MAEDEEEEDGGDPDPADLDKEDVEDVRFFGEVAGGYVCRVGLQGCAVGCVAGLRVEDAEQGAEEEGEGVDC